MHTPAISTVHAVLDRHGLVKHRTRRRNRAEGTSLSRPAQPNELWCADSTLMEEKLKARTKIEWAERLIALGIPAGPIYNLSEAFADPRVRHCNMVEEIWHPEIGLLRQVASPIRMEALGPCTSRRAPPWLGEHTFEVLGEYGITAERIAALANAAVILQHS